VAADHRVVLADDEAVRIVSPALPGYVCVASPSGRPQLDDGAKCAATHALHNNLIMKIIPDIRVPSGPRRRLSMVGHRKRATTMTAPRPRSPQPKQLDAGIPGRDQLVRSAAAHRGQGRQDDPDLHRGGAAVRRRAPARPAQLGQAGRQHIQRWMCWLLDRYSNAYASNQYRALQQFFKLLAARSPPSMSFACCGSHYSGP